MAASVSNINQHNISHRCLYIIHRPLGRVLFIHRPHATSVPAEAVKEVVSTTEAAVAAELPHLPEMPLDLGAGIVLPLRSVQNFQAVVDCWMSSEAGGAWMASGKYGLLYEPGRFTGPRHQNIGKDPFQWTPSFSCERSWSTWNKYCAMQTFALFHGAFFVGDSISQQQFFSLVSAFHVPTSRLSGSCYQGDSAFGKVNSIPFYFSRNDALDLTTSTAVLRGLECWTSQLVAGPYRLVVLNRGAHYVNDDLLIAQLNETFTWLHAFVPHAVLVWRTTVPGALSCSNYNTERVYANLSATTRAKYHWNDFQRQNQLVRNLFRQRFPRVLVLDPVSASMMRPGTHMGLI
jgi:hypothetical protein